MPRAVDITGTRFGRLTAVRREYCHKTRGWYWRCACDCGAEIVACLGNIRSGNTRSCGCLKLDTTKARSTTHGDTGSSEYMSWADMIARCHRPNHKAFANYGGRGIRVCRRWHKFESFLADMGRRPSRQHSIERVNNDKGYSPDNCVWATRKAQSRNQRTNRTIDTPKGPMLLCEAADVSGISAHTLWKRLNRKWPIKRLFEQPKRRNA